MHRGTLRRAKAISIARLPITRKQFGSIPKTPINFITEAIPSVTKEAMSEQSRTTRRELNWSPTTHACGVSAAGHARLSVSNCKRRLRTVTRPAA
jgi:hypothetical protein